MLWLSWTTLGIFQLLTAVWDYLSPCDMLSCAKFVAVRILRARSHPVRRLVECILEQIDRVHVRFSREVISAMIPDPDVKPLQAVGTFRRDVKYSARMHAHALTTVELTASTPVWETLKNWSVKKCRPKQLSTWQWSKDVDNDSRGYGWTSVKVKPCGHCKRPNVWRIGVLIAAYEHSIAKIMHTTESCILRLKLAPLVVNATSILETTTVSLLRS